MILALKLESMFLMFKTVGQLLVNNGRAVQSVRFTSIFELGYFDIALEALNYLDPDEICILDLNGNVENTLHDNIVLINQLSLPVCVGGGAHPKILQKFPVERLIMNSSIFNNQSEKNDLTAGKQSLIAYLPYKFFERRLYVYNSSIKNFTEVKLDFFSGILEYFSEMVLLDANGQGVKDGFCEDIFDLIPKTIVHRIYLSGGMNSEHIYRCKDLGYSGVIIDNTSLYSSQKIFRRYFDAM